MPSPLTELSPSTRKHLANFRPRNETELWVWMRKVLGYGVPRRAMCPEHSSPYQALADAFFHRIRKALWIANRTGGKTRNISLLHHANSSFKKDCWTFHSSTVKEQAERCRHYVEEYFRIPEIAPNKDEDSSVIKTLTYRPTRAKIEVQAGTMGQFSGPKPQVLGLDEVEFLKWENFQQSIGMAHSLPHIPSLMLYGSTRQRIFGTMNRLSENAGRLGLATYQWCVWEVMSPCPIRSRACSLWNRCEGTKCQNSEGFWTPSDVFEKAEITDPETWDTQYECKRPSRKGLVFDTFDPAIHVNMYRADYNPRFPVYLGADWGYTSPAAVLFFQVHNETAWCFDEIYVQRKLNDQVLDLVVRKQQQYQCKFSMGWGDQEDPDANARFRKGLHPAAWFLGEVELMPRLRSVRERLLTVTGHTTLFFHPRCTNTLREFNLYHNKEAGSMSSEGEPIYLDEPEDEDNHAMDALGYFCAGMRKHHRVTMRDVITVTTPEPGELPRGRPDWPMPRPFGTKEKKF